MFLLSGRDAPIPLSHNGVCKTGHWGRRCSKACPSHKPGRSHGMERTTWERRWEKHKTPRHTAPGCYKGWGGGRWYLPAAPSKTERVCRLLSLQPFLLHQFERAQEWTQGSHRQSSTTYKMGNKNPKPTTTVILTRNVGLEGTNGCKEDRQVQITSSGFMLNK